MPIIINRKMTLEAQRSGTSGKPLIGWQSYVNRGNIVAESEDQYWPVSNLGNTNTALEWRSTSIDTQTITVSLNGTEPIDYIAVARHNLASAGVEIRVDAVYAGTAPDAWVPVIGGVILGTDGPAMLRFDEIHPIEVRITLIPTDTPPRAAVLYIGKMTVMESGIAQEVVPMAFSLETDVATGRAESGDFLGRIITDQKRQLNYTFEYVDYNWFKRELGGFVQESMTRPFFMAWLPNVYPDEVFYGWLNSDVRPTAVNFQGDILVTFDMDISAIA